MRLAGSRWGLFLLVAAVISTGVHAGDYPERAVRIIAAGQGSLMDVVARQLGRRLSERWGQPVVVENKPGAAFTIGTAVAAHAKPDGYTLVMSDRTALAAAPHLYKDLAYDPFKDFAPVSLVAVAPLVLVAHPSFPATTMQELVEYARRNAGLQFGTQGMTTTAHFAGELLRVETGISPQYVHYKGAAESQLAMLRGEVLVGFTNGPSTYPLIAAKRLKAFAVTSSTRLAAAPEIPTTAEVGYPGVELEYWVGMLAPAGTPSAVIAKLNTDIASELRTADMQSVLLKQGAEIAVGTPQEFAARLRADHARIGHDAQRIGFSVE
jgi:tripartite-type tricarboxylate transporter receptor subunit TctC